MARSAPVSQHLKTLLIPVGVWWRVVKTSNLSKRYDVVSWSKDVLDCNSLPFFAGIQDVPQLDFAEVLMTIFLRTGWYHLMSKHDQTNYRCKVKWRIRLAQRNMVERWNSFEIRMIASSWYGENTWLFTFKKNMFSNISPFISMGDKPVGLSFSFRRWNGLKNWVRCTLSKSSWAR